MSLKILALRDGRLVKAYDGLDEAAEATDVEVGKISTLIMNGKESANGLCFDLGIDYIDYTGYGYERN
jgi:hypothetical protein